jgi:hypothetical protein
LIRKNVSHVADIGAVHGGIPARAAIGDMQRAVGALNHRQCAERDLIEMQGNLARNLAVAFVALIKLDRDRQVLFVNQPKFALGRIGSSSARRVFEAAKRLGWKTIRADIISVDHELQYAMVELSENLDRRDLTAEQRRRMKEHLRDCQTRLMESIAPAKGGRGKKGGKSDAARKAGMSRPTAQRRAKAAHNTHNGQVSADASEPAAADKPAVAAAKSQWERHKIVFDMSVGDVRALDAFIAANHYESRSECIRDAVRKFIGLGEARAA